MLKVFLQRKSLLAVFEFSFNLLNRQSCKIRWLKKSIHGVFITKHCYSYYFARNKIIYNFVIKWFRMQNLRNFGGSVSYVCFQRNVRQPTVCRWNARQTHRYQTTSGNRIPRLLENFTEQIAKKDIKEHVLSLFKYLMSHVYTFTYILSNNCANITIVSCIYLSGTLLGKAVM